MIPTEKYSLLNNIYYVIIRVINFVGDIMKEINIIFEIKNKTQLSN